MAAVTKIPIAENDVDKPADYIAAEEGEAAANKIIAMPWEFREFFMDEFMLCLRMKLCMTCWYENPNCRCADED